MTLNEGTGLEDIIEVPAIERKPVLRTNRYEIGKEIGRGCWGTVYAAKDNETGQEVAIKVFDPNEIAKEQMRHRNIDPYEVMRKEGGKLANLPNVVPRRLEVDEDGNRFVVMPRYE